MAREAYRDWILDGTRHSFKTLASDSGLCSIRIHRQYRAVGVLNGDTVTWFWIGTKNEFMKQF